MITIGLTGGIGSGKTTVAKIFSLLGVPIFFADLEAKKIYDENDVREQISKIFGENIYTGDKKIDKKLLSAKIFDDKNLLNELSKIIHPRVQQHFENWLKKQDAPYVLLEAAILFESGFYKFVDKTIFVTAPENIRIIRCIERDLVGYAEIKKRINNQMDQDVLTKKADFIIVNDNKTAILPQILEIHKKILRAK